MSSLTDLDKQMLRRAASIRCNPGCDHDKVARKIADHLRTRFPDLADAELAAVLINLAGPLAAVAKANQLTGTAITGFVAGVAADLAALEIGDETP
jgi:hypothetical protein